MSAKVFISYARQDAEFALRLAGVLEEHGFKVWGDWALVPGDTWADEIESALKACSVFLLILSPEALSSESLRRELRPVVSLGKPVIVLAYRDIEPAELPSELVGYPKLSFSSEQYEHSLDELLQALSAAEASAPDLERGEVRAAMKMDEALPPLPAAPAPAPLAAAPAPVSVEVDGDVGGNLEVAGRDIIKTNGGNVIVLSDREQALRYERQARRFDAAFPDKAEHKKTATLWVGVARPDDPPPFEGVPAETVTSGPTADIPLPVDPVSGELQEVHVEVQVRAPQYEPSKDSATLTVYPDGRPDRVRFLLEAQDEGQGIILVQFYLDKKRLGEIELASVVERARAGQKFTFSLQIATLYLAFGVG